MSESNRMDLNSLHHTVLRETEDDSVQELDPDFYRDLSEFIGGLRRQEFDGVEGKIKESMIEMAKELTSTLLRVRLDKISGASRGGLAADDGDGGDADGTRQQQQLGHLLDEEKFILDSKEDLAERTEMVLSAMIDGRSKFLESLSQGHKTRRILIRFRVDIDELVGADLEKYGPFKAEDIATVPYENAQALISNGMATKIRWEED